MAGLIYRALESEAAHLARTPEISLMQSFSVRFFFHAAGAIALAALAPLASAQVTLNLTTTQQTNCTATTDAQGLRLVSGSTDLSATGVTLSGDGCGTNPASDNYETTINVPGTATVGTPFTVTWSASAAATRCVYGGTTGLAGWPVGSSACQGANCSGSHQASVTVPNAGSYSLSVACTNDSGYKAGSGTAGGAATAPVFTTALAVSPTGITLGQSFSASWAVSGATSCEGSATLDGAAVTLSGWTGSVSPTASPKTLTPTQAGTYALKLACTNQVGTTTSGPVAVSVQASSDSCPAGQQTTAEVCYSNYGNACTAMPITTWDSMFGHLANGDELSPFPGVQSYTNLRNWDKTKYIALKFTVPAGLPWNQWGAVFHGETNPGPAELDFAISSGCGDFNPSSSYCKATKVVLGTAGAKWRVPTAVGASLPTAACVVTPGQSYYLNIRATNPAAGGTTCTGNICRTSFNNNHTP